MPEDKYSVPTPSTNLAYKVYGFLFIVVITFLCFMPDLRNNLLSWDDTSYITYNEKIKSFSLETVKWAFSEFHLNYWAPLTWLSYSLDYKIWGLNPIGYHLSNNIIHALNAGLFFLLFLQLLNITTTCDNTEVNFSPKIMIYTSLLASLVFSLHPLRVESVAWAAERKDVLFLFFGIGSVMAYLRYATVHSNLSFAIKSPYFLLSIILYCFSLLGKSTLVSLPLILILLDWFPLKRIKMKNILFILIEKIPFFIFAFIASNLTYTAHKQYGSIMPLEESDILSRTLLAFKAISSYILMTFYPFDISPYYIHPGNIRHIGLSYMLPILFFVTVSLCCAWYMGRKPLLLTFWLSYLFLLSPVLGFVKAGNEGIAARFSYAASLPVSMAISLAVFTFIKRCSKEQKIGATAITVSTLVLLGATTIKHISFWKDDVSLWTRVISLHPHSMGRAYFQRSNAYIAIGSFPNALSDANEALAIAIRKKVQHLYPIYETRATIHKNIGEFNAALTDYDNAIASASATRSPKLSYYYQQRGNMHLEMGNRAQADDDFQKAQQTGVK